MAIEKSAAISLGSMQLGDTSRIVSFLAQDFGLVRCVAKGSRSKRSRFGHALEPLMHAAIVFYHHPRKELFTLSQADLIDHFPRIRGDLLKTAYAQVAADLLRRVLLPAGQEASLYLRTLQFLQELERDHVSELGAQALVAFIRELCGILGFAPDLQGNPCCGTDTNQVYFDLARGRVGCKSCTGQNHHRSVSLTAWRLLAKADSALPLSSAVRRESLALLLDFLSCHMEKPLRLPSLLFLEAVQ